MLSGTSVPWKKTQNILLRQREKKGVKEERESRGERRHGDMEMEEEKRKGGGGKERRREVN